jgi:hypothetical protein
MGGAGSLRRIIGGAVLALLAPASAQAADLTINVPYEIRSPGPGWSAFGITCIADTQANIDALARGAMGAVIASGRTERIPLAGPASGTARVELSVSGGRGRPISEAEAYSCSIYVHGAGDAVVPREQVDQPASTLRVTGRLPR